MWQRLFVYRSMINDTVLDAKMYIEKSRDPDPEYWSEELLKIMEKADSDSQLDASEQKDIINLIEKANEQLNIKLLSTAKFEGGVDPNDYTRLDKHLQSEESSPPPEVAVKPQTDLWGRPIQKNLAPPQQIQSPPSSPPPQPMGKILGNLTPGNMPLGPTVRAIDGIPLEQFLLDKSKSKFKSLRT